MSGSFGKRIHDLDPATTVASGDEFEFSLTGALGSRRITFANLFAAIAGFFGFYVLQPSEDPTKVVSKGYPFGNVKRYGATGDGVTDDSTAILAAVAALQASTVLTREVFFPAGNYILSQTAKLAVAGMRFRGDASGIFGGSQIVSGSRLLWAGAGPMIQLGENRQRTIISITRASGVVTVTYAAMYPGFQNGGQVTIVGCTDSSFNGTFTLTSGSFQSNTSTTFNQAGANATSSGGTITSNFDNGEYDDVAEYFTVQDMTLTTANPTTPLLNGFSNYAAGTTAIQDWRNGNIQLKNVEISHFETGVWGICSDINQWTFVFIRYNHIGFYLGPRSDQFVINGMWSKYNDTVCILDSCSMARIHDWQVDSDGSSTTPAVQLTAAYGRSTGGIIFSNTSWENYSGGGVYRAFAELGIGSTYPVRDVVFENPGMFTHASPLTPRTQYLVSMDNADGVYIRGIHDRADDTILRLDAVVEFRGTTSPTRVLIEKGTHAITTPVVNSGTGSPVYTVTDPAGTREIISSGVTESTAQLTLRSSADRNSRTTFASSKDGANGTTIRIDPIPPSGTADALIEMLRSVNTTGVRQVIVRRGDGTGNAAYTLDVTSGVTLSNGLDVPNGITLDSGLTAAQNTQVTMKDRGTAQWAVGKNGSNQYTIFDFTAAGGGTTRIKVFPAAGMTFSPGATNQQLTVTDFAGATQVAIDYDAGVGTFYGGVRAGQTGTLITRTMVYTPSITPASVAAASVSEQTFSVPGLTTADKVIVNPPATANNLGIVGARVSAADTLAIRFVNPTAGALTPTAGTYTVLALRS